MCTDHARCVAILFWFFSEVFLKKSKSNFFQKTTIKASKKILAFFKCSAFWATHSKIDGIFFDVFARHNPHTEGAQLFSFAVPQPRYTLGGGTTHSKICTAWCEFGRQNEKTKTKSQRIAHGRYTLRVYRPAIIKKGGCDQKCSSHSPFFNDTMYSFSF